jgi:hypothetical protein
MKKQTLWKIFGTKSVHFFLAISAISSAISCGGTRNTTSEKQEAFEIKNTYLEGSKVVLGSIFIYEPVDPLKPFKIDGKEYKNVKIKSSKTKTVEKWKIKTIYRTRTIYRTKISERENNTYLWVGIVGVIAFFASLLIYLPKLKIPNLKI